MGVRTVSSSGRFTPGDVKWNMYIMDVSEPPVALYELETRGLSIHARIQTQITHLIARQIAC
jgi:hypothetical protein